MARKKVKLAWITNNAARKTCMKKRRLSLMKKVQELSTLCGVQTFCIFHSPDEIDPVVWPVEYGEASRTLTRFLAMPKAERSKRTTTQERYLRDQVNKLQIKQMDHLRVMNELELAYLMDEAFYGRGIDGLGQPGLECLSLLLKEKVKQIREIADVNSKFELFKGESAMKKAKRDLGALSSVVNEVEGNGVVLQNSVANVQVGEEGGGGDSGGDLYDVAAEMVGKFVGDVEGAFGGDFQLQAFDDSADNTM